jgi:hypothetical protein
VTAIEADENLKGVLQFLTCLVVKRTSLCH